MPCNWCFLTQHTFILRAKQFLFLVVVFNAQALGWIPFTFFHPSTILHLTEYSQSLKLCILEDYLDSLWSYILCIRHTLGMDKLTVYKWTARQLWPVIRQKLATAFPLGKSGILVLFLTILLPGFVLAFSGILSCKVSLGILIVNLAEWTNSWHSCCTLIRQVNLSFHYPQLCSGMGINWTSIYFWRPFNCLIDEGISVTLLSVHLLILLAFLPFLIFSSLENLPRFHFWCKTLI